MAAKAEIKYGVARVISPVLKRSWGFLEARGFGLTEPTNSLIALKGFGEADDDTRVNRAIEAFNSYGVLGLVDGGDLPQDDERWLRIASDYLLLTEEEVAKLESEVGESKPPDDSRPSEGKLELFSATVAGLDELDKSKTPTRYLRAAQEVARGRFPAEIVPDLQRVRFLPDGGADVPDWPSFAAWSLDQALRRRPKQIELKPCERCGLPWLASTAARYCSRMAPGSWHLTCLDLGKARDYRARKEGE